MLHTFDVLRYWYIKWTRKVYSILRKRCPRCDFFIDVLERNGVLKESIIKEDKAAFTKENAILSRKVIDEKASRLNLP